MRKIGMRLREERARLNKNQEDFALLGGVKRNAQARYERDERYPDAAYLAELAGAGVDVNYVITGVRFRPNVSERLTEMLRVTAKVEPDGGPITAKAHQAIQAEAEQALLADYRACSDAGKQALETAATAMAQQAAGDAKKE